MEGVEGQMKELGWWENYVFSGKDVMPAGWVG